MARRKDTDRRQDGEAGFALLAVTVIIMVLAISGLAVYQIASQEHRQADYEMQRTTARYLAEGAIERARARLLGDFSWVGDIADTTAFGRYAVAVAGTTSDGGGPALFLNAAGHVGDARWGAHRGVQVIAEVGPSALALGLLVRGEPNVFNPFRHCGDVHLELGDLADGAALESTCGADSSRYTHGFQIPPPPVYVDRNYFDNATYYWIRPRVEGTDFSAEVFCDGVSFTDSIPDHMASVIRQLITTQGEVEFLFDSDLEIRQYFDEVNGYFRPRGGATAAVVDFFGDYPMVDGFTDPTLRCKLDIDGTGAAVITATLINTRFVGVPDTPAERIQPSSWVGGRVYLRRVALAPRNGIAVIAHRFNGWGGAGVTCGRVGNPALVYVTGNAEDVRSEFRFHGSVFCLGTWRSSGGASLVYDPSLVSSLLLYFQSEVMPQDLDSPLNILSWHEVAVDPDGS